MMNPDDVKGTLSFERRSTARVAVSMCSFFTMMIQLQIIIIIVVMLALESVDISVLQMRLSLGLPLFWSLDADTRSGLHAQLRHFFAALS